MGRNKKQRTVQAMANLVVAYELGKLDGYVARQQQKKFDELLRKGVIIGGRK